MWEDCRLKNIISKHFPHSFSKIKYPQFRISGHHWYTESRKEKELIEMYKKINFKLSLILHFLMGARGDLESDLRADDIIKWILKWFSPVFFFGDIQVRLRSFERAWSLKNQVFIYWHQMLLCSLSFSYFIVYHFIHFYLHLIWKRRKKHNLIIKSNKNKNDLE